MEASSFINGGALFIQRHFAHLNVTSSKNICSSSSAHLKSEICTSTTNLHIQKYDQPPTISRTDAPKIA
jgi:hypothetical protein